MQTTRKTNATAKARRLAPLSLCGARNALKYLHALMAEMEGVRQAEDRECVHRMRVASHRLRSVLPLFAFSLSRQTSVRLYHNSQQRRVQDYQEFVTFWDQLQAQGVWKRLRQTLADPHVAAEASAETDTAVLAEEGASAPTHQDVAHPV